MWRAVYRVLAEHKHSTQNPTDIQTNLPTKQHQQAFLLKRTDKQFSDKREKLSEIHLEIRYCRYLVTRQDQGVVSQDSRSGVKDSRSWIQGFKELDSRTEGVADCTVVS